MSFSAKTLVAGFVAIGSVCLVSGVVASRSLTHACPQPENTLANITIDYPLNGSVFPPEITAPTFLWHDSTESVGHWVVEVSFGKHAAEIRVEVHGEHMRMGEIDPAAGAASGVVQLTPEQAAAWVWRPDERTWTKIKKESVRAPATVTLSGFTDNSTLPVSRGKVEIRTSPDPVGAPIFYRDVPLMTTPRAEKGSIQPLPTSALPLIKWRVRDIGEPQSRVVMEKLYTCANCHSFSSDGKTLGLDVDGPKNDKGLYALVPVAKNMTIRTQDVIRWSSFQENLEAPSSDPAVKRFGFMSQVSPDGRYVVTSIGPPVAGNVHQKENPTFAPGLSDRLFSMNYKDLSFTQVFYPTRGILAWYDRKEKKLRPLHGADDPRFVQTSAFWSPDGKYLVFSRAEARDPYPPESEKPEHANDPNEPRIQYDLYRIPFNEGRGGEAEPVVGASGNGMSNNFPKVSPDGRWIVFVENRNGLLMRPDSQLHIVPFAGGKARRMNCNTSLMNSWHSFSPNGRWLAFSSKSRSPYTQLMLTHVDKDGNDTPAILVENTTAANRAVNIPEFVNVRADGLEKIDPQVTEFYHLATDAFQMMESGQMVEAVQEWRKAIQLDPDDASAHFGLAVALTASNQEREAVEEYRRACALDAHQAAWFAHLAASLVQTGDLDGAVENFQKSLALDSTNAGTEADFGAALFENGQTAEGLSHMEKAIEMAPDFADGHSYLGTALAKVGRMDEAVDQMQIAIALAPNSFEYRFDLGFLLKSRGDYPGAVAAFEKSVELGGGTNWQCLAALADAYDRNGQPGQAVPYAQRALDLAIQDHNESLEKDLRDALERYQRNGANAQPQ